MASLAVRYQTAASDELEEAMDWYAARDLQVADNFSRFYTAKLAEVAASPHHGPLDADGVRQIHLSPYSYYLIVREFRGVLEVVAVAHTSRLPGYWRNRLRE
jgi:plasmid stabilization system protein ParE